MRAFPRLLAQLQSRAYILVLRLSQALLRIVSSPSDELRLKLLVWICNYPAFFDGLRPTIGELVKRFGTMDRPDGTHREGVTRTAIRHHVTVLLERGLISKSGSTVWATDAGKEIAASQSI